MFCGQKFEAAQKRHVAQYVGFHPSILDDNASQMTVLINTIDNWASGFGYEYHSMTDTCVVFKRVGD